MSTRLRPIMMMGGEIRTGGYVRLTLESYASSYRLKDIPKRGSMPESERLIALFKAVKSANKLDDGFLWLFREPNKIASNRSRYAQLCQYYGIGPRIGKKKKLFSQESLLQRVQRQEEEFRRERAAAVGELQELAARWSQPQQRVRVTDPFLGQPQVATATGSQSLSDWDTFRIRIPEVTLPPDPSLAQDDVVRASRPFWEDEQP